MFRPIKSSYIGASRPNTCKFYNNLKWLKRHSKQIYYFIIAIIWRKSAGKGWLSSMFTILKSFIYKKKKKHSVIHYKIKKNISFLNYLNDIWLVSMSFRVLCIHLVGFRHSSSVFPVISQNLSLHIGQASDTILFTILELALVDSSICPLELSFSILQILLIITSIGVSILPIEPPLTMLHPILKHSSVFRSLFHVNQFSNSFLQSIYKLTSIQFFIAYI